MVRDRRHFEDEYYLVQHVSNGEWINSTNAIYSFEEAKHQYAVARGGQVRLVRANSVLDWTVIAPTSGSDWRKPSLDRPV